jgi:hypothetical protein
LRSHWRASLETPETGRRLGFATLEQLFVYLADFCEGRNTDEQIDLRAALAQPDEPEPDRKLPAEG